MLIAAPAGFGGAADGESMRLDDAVGFGLSKRLVLNPSRLRCSSNCFNGILFFACPDRSDFKAAADLFSEYVVDFAGGPVSTRNLSDMKSSSESDMSTMGVICLEE
jgi:hypothetical protein